MNYRIAIILLISFLVLSLTYSPAYGTPVYQKKVEKFKICSCGGTKDRQLKNMTIIINRRIKEGWVLKECHPSTNCIYIFTFEKGCK